MSGQTTGISDARAPTSRRNSERPLVRLDAEVFEALSLASAPEDGAQSRIVRWFECWATGDD